MKYTRNDDLAKKLTPLAWILTVVILAVVGSMRYIHFDLDIDLSWLAPFHSAVNALAGVVLLVAVNFVRKGDVKNHKRAIFVAMLLSLIFLVSYVLYHTTQGEVSYCKEGTIRIVYFILLITHILSAAIIFPFVLFTFIRGYAFQVDKHKRMAKWVYPVWLYVCFTGPITYLMLQPCIN